MYLLLWVTGKISFKTIYRCPAANPNKSFVISSPIKKPRPNKNQGKYSPNKYFNFYFVLWTLIP